MRKIIFLFFPVCFFLVNGLLAQVVGENLAFLPDYKQQLPYFQELITGGQYQEPSRLIEGDPFYFSRQFEKGTLVINGVSYPEVPLLYDIYKDQLVTFHPVFNQKILIKPEKIDGFSLSNGDEFQYFSENTAYLRNGNGLYEILGRGEFLALAKRYKTTKEKREMSAYDQIYQEKSDYFLYHEGKFSSVKKGSQAILILGLDKKEVRKEIKANDLNFKQNPGKYLRYLVQVQ